MLMTPKSAGYAMPPEWAPHEATWLTWPCNRETWPTQLEAVRAVWIEMATILSATERVNLLVNDAGTGQAVTSRLQATGADMKNIRLLQIPAVDVWMRDYGPTFVTRSGTDAPLAMNDWIFNGWGGKYPAYEDDDEIAKVIAAQLAVPVFAHDLILEGGSIEVNGDRVCLTTEQCLLNPNRNPHKSRGELEDFLRQSLNVDQIIWLGEGIVGDDTDGHIDDIARFVSPHTIVAIREADSQDENYRLLEDNWERLRTARNADGHSFDLVALPCPAPVSCDGTRLPASYANFYIANGVVLVPVFDDPNDAVALGILRELFPDRRVHGLQCTDVVAGLGAIHCVTQQQPC